jgi:prolipoprotein diacylglyceryltransferase
MTWLGCWAAGSAYGTTLEPGTWWGMMMVDESGVISLRVPLQPIASITLFIVMSLVEWKARNMGCGFTFGWVGLILSLHTLVFSFLRSDAVQILFGLRLDTWLAMLLVAGFTIFIVILYKKAAKEDKMKRRNTTQEVAA